MNNSIKNYVSPHIHKCYPTQPEYPNGLTSDTLKLIFSFLNKQELSQASLASKTFFVAAQSIFSEWSDLLFSASLIWPEKNPHDIMACNAETIKNRALHLGKNFTSNQYKSIISSSIDANQQLTKISVWGKSIAYRTLSANSISYGISLCTLPSQKFAYYPGEARTFYQGKVYWPTNLVGLRMLNISASQGSVSKSYLCPAFNNFYIIDPFLVLFDQKKSMISINAIPQENAKLKNEFEIPNTGTPCAVTQDQKNSHILYILASEASQKLYCLHKWNSKTNEHKIINTQIQSSQSNTTLSVSGNTALITSNSIDSSPISLETGKSLELGNTPFLTGILQKNYYIGATTNTLEKWDTNSCKLIQSWRLNDDEKIIKIYPVTHNLFLTAAIDPTNTQATSGKIIVWNQSKGRCTEFPNLFSFSPKSENNVLPEFSGSILVYQKDRVIEARDFSQAD